MPGTKTARSLSDRNWPWVDGLIGEDGIVKTEAWELSITFYCSSTPLMPAPESRICIDDCFVIVSMRTS